MFRLKLLATTGLTIIIKGGILQLYFRFETSTLQVAVCKTLDVLTGKRLHRQLDIGSEV